MNLPAQTYRDMDPEHDALLARAIDHVLEAERSAQIAVADFERQTIESLELARQQRRTILERAHRRIMTLHARVSHALEQRTAQIRESQGEIPDGGAAQAPDRERLRAAIERLAERLTTVADGDP